MQSVKNLMSMERKLYAETMDSINASREKRVTFVY